MTPQIFRESLLRRRENIMHKRFGNGKRVTLSNTLSTLSLTALTFLPISHPFHLPLQMIDVGTIQVWFFQLHRSNPWLVDDFIDFRGITYRRGINRLYLHE